MNLSPPALAAAATCSARICCSVFTIWISNDPKLKQFASNKFHPGAITTLQHYNISLSYRYRCFNCRHLIQLFFNICQGAGVRKKKLMILRRNKQFWGIWPFSVMWWLFQPKYVSRLSISIPGSSEWSVTGAGWCYPPTTSWCAPWPTSTTSAASSASCAASHCRCRHYTLDISETSII